MIKKCIRCGREERIYAKEMCMSCYNSLKILKNPERYKKNLENAKKYHKKTKYYRSEKWKKYFRDYQRKKLKIPKSRWRK